MLRVQTVLHQQRMGFLTRVGTILGGVVLIAPAAIPARAQAFADRAGSARIATIQ
jgi:hypothetical protein